MPLPIIRRAELGQSGTWYRVHVGSFATSEQATALCNNLKDAGASASCRGTEPHQFFSRKARYPPSGSTNSGTMLVKARGEPR